MPLTSNNHVQSSIHPMDQLHHSLDLCLNNNEKHLPNIILGFIDPEHHHYLDFCEKCRCLDSVDAWTRTCNVCHTKDKLLAEFNNRVHMYSYLNGRFKGVSTNKFKHKIHSYFDRLTTPPDLSSPPQLIFHFY